MRGGSIDKHHILLMIESIGYEFETHYIAPFQLNERLKQFEYLTDYGFTVINTDEFEFRITGDTSSTDADVTPFEEVDELIRDTIFGAVFNIKDKNMS